MTIRKRIISTKTALLIAILVSISQTHAQSKWPQGVIGGLRHTGALHLYALPGPLTVDLYKQDLKSSAKVDRTATVFLTGPDGSVIAQQRIDSPPGKWANTDSPLQHIHFSTDIIHAGVYTVFITCNGDPYLRRSQLWGFSTNADRYLINSSAGHVDGRREEPIMLHGDRQPTSIFFKPMSRTLQVDIDQLPQNAGTIELRNPDNKLVWRSNDVEGKASTGEITDIPDGIWELRLPIARSNVLIKGLNHQFEKGKPVLPVWSTSRSRHFDLESVHWLLQPRRVSRQLKPGSQGTLAFSVFNNSAKPVTYQLTTQHDTNFPGTTTLSVPEIQVAPQTVDTVHVAYSIPQGTADGAYQFHIVVTDPNTKAQAFSLGEIRVSAQEVSTEVTLPLQLKLFEHDQFQFAHEPDYPRDNEFYFDKDNRPWVVTPSEIKTLHDGTWKTVSIPNYRTDEVDFRLSALGTDNNGYVYAIVYLKKQPHYIRVSGETLNAEAVPLPGGGAYSIETSGASTETQFPPAIVRHLRDRSKKRVSKWAVIHDVELIVPEIRDGKLQLLPAIHISDNGVGVSQHSGRPNVVVSDEDNIHLVWGETTDPEEKAPGVPTYTATYHRKTGKLSPKTFIAHAPPANDAHNTPSILMDAKGNRHIITGAHNKPFVYRMATKGSENWLPAEQVSDLTQTYVGAMTDRSGGIHLFYRIWQRGDNFPGIFRASIYHQYKSPDGGKWATPQAFALPPLQAYSVFRHRVTRDRMGYLYVNMDYWSTWTAYRESYRHGETTPPAPTRLNLVSKDNGATWHILRGDDLRRAPEIYRQARHTR